MPYLVQKEAAELVMKSDLLIFQGRWSQVAFEDNGTTDAPDTHGSPKAVMTISGQTFHVTVPGEEPLIEGTFTMDVSAHPKRIDWIDSIGDDAGKLIPAIYEFEENGFRFAAADPGMTRPEDFFGGQGITIRAFVRI